MKAIWKQFRHLWQTGGRKSHRPRPVRLALEALEDRTLLSGTSLLAGQVTRIQFSGIPVGTALTTQFLLQGLAFVGTASSATTPVTSLVPAGQTGAGTEVASIPTVVPTVNTSGQSLTGSGSKPTTPIPTLTGLFSKREQAVSVQVGEEAVPQGSDTAVLTLEAFDAAGHLLGQSQPVTVTAGAGFKSVLAFQRNQGDIRSFTVIARPQDANKPLEIAGITYQAPFVPPALPYFTYTSDSFGSPGLVIHPGETIKDHITIVYFNNPAGGPIQFSVSGLPQGVTATFVPSTDVTIPFPYSVFGLPQGAKVAAADMILSAAGNAPYSLEEPVNHYTPYPNLSALTLTAKSVDGKAGPGFNGNSYSDEDTGLTTTWPIELEVRPQFFVDVYSPSNNYETELDALPGGEIDGYIRVAREPNFSGPVNLSFKGLPAGVQGQFSPSTLKPGNTQTSFRLSLSPNVSWGGHSITLEATSGYLAPVDVPLTLTVQDPIQAKYQELSQTVNLGNALGPEARTTDGQGVVQGFQYGTVSGSWNSYIYWWPNTGAYEIEGSIYQQYKLMNQAQGPLGRVTSDVFVPHYIEDHQYTLRSVFERGAIQDDSYSNGLPNLILVAFKLNDTTMRFYWTNSQYYDFFQVRYAVVGQPDTQVTINASGGAGYFDLGGLAVNMPYHFSVQGATNKGFLQGASYTDWAQPIFVSSGNFTPPAPQPPPKTPPQTPDNLPWLVFNPNALGESVTLSPLDLGAIAPKADKPFTVSWQDYNFSNNNAGAYVDRLVVYQEQDNNVSQIVYDSSTAAPDSLKVDQLGAWKLQNQSVSFDSGLPAGLYTFEVTLNWNRAVKENTYVPTGDAYGIDIEPDTRLPAISGQSTGKQPPPMPSPIPASTSVATSLPPLATVQSGSPVPVAQKAGGTVVAMATSTSTGSGPSQFAAGVVATATAVKPLPQRRAPLMS